MLKNEPDACKVRLEGFATAQNQEHNQHAGFEEDDNETSESNQPSSPQYVRTCTSIEYCIPKYCFTHHARLYVNTAYIIIQK